MWLLSKPKIGALLILILGVVQAMTEPSDMARDLLPQVDRSSFGLRRKSFVSA